MCWCRSVVEYLRIFERRILRKVFGPVQNEGGFWRIKNELRSERPNKKRRYSEICRKGKIMTWLGHVMRMEGKRIPKRLLGRKPTGRRNTGRPRKRWIEDIEVDIQIIGIRG